MSASISETRLHENLDRLSEGRNRHSVFNDFLDFSMLMLNMEKDCSGEAMEE